MTLTFFGILTIWYRETTAEMADPMKICVSWPTMAGRANRPWAAASPVMYDITVTDVRGGE